MSLLIPSDKCVCQEHKGFLRCLVCGKDYSYKTNSIKTDKGYLVCKKHPKYNNLCH